MKTIVRVMALMAALILAAGAPAYARGGGGHAGGGHAFGGRHPGAFGHRGVPGHHGFNRRRVGGFVAVAPFWGGDPFWSNAYAYGPYAYEPYASAPVPAAPPVYIEKPQAGYCPSNPTYSADVQSCGQPWQKAAPPAG